MEKRIQILNCLTVIVILLFAVVQGDWLYSRYEYTVQTCADSLYKRVAASVDQYDTMRQSAVNHDTAVEYTTRRFTRDGVEMFLFDIYTADLRHSLAADSVSADLFSRIYEKQHPEWLNREVMVVVVDRERKESEVLDAIERSCLDRRIPFSAGQLDSIMRSNRICPDTVFTETADSVVWEPSARRSGRCSGPHSPSPFPTTSWAGSWHASTAGSRCRRFSASCRTSCWFRWFCPRC